MFRFVSTLLMRVVELSSLYVAAAFPLSNSLDFVESVEFVDQPPFNIPWDSPYDAGLTRVSNDVQVIAWVGSWRTPKTCRAPL